ncbi:MAG: tetratricopeptide repeat protein [Candidatus Omnitrophota bacterium]
MKKKTKISILLILITLFTVQIITYAYDHYHVRGTYLYKQKMTGLKIAAKLAEHTGEKEEIKAEQQKLIQTHQEYLDNPAISEKDKKKAKRRLAEAELKEGNEVEALQICDELLCQNPEDKAALKVKARIYWEKGKELTEERRYQEAIAIYEEIISWDITPELSAFFKNIIVDTYLYAGDREMALFWCKKIMEEHGDLLNCPAFALKRMADLHAEQGDIDMARELYQKVIDNHAKSAWINAAKKALKELDKDGT